MPDESVADYIRKWQGGRSLRELARETGVHHSVLSEQVGGRRPTLPIALRIADSLKLPPEERAGWFAACGFEDPRSAPDLVYEPILDQTTVQAFREAELPPEDIAAINEEMRRLIAERRRAKGQW